MNLIKNTIWFKSYLTVLFFVATSNLFAQGHYNGGSFNPNDYFVPSAKGWVFSLYYSYSQMDYYNDSRNKTDVIEINENPPILIVMGQNVRTHSVIPMISYFGEIKMLKARWGILALPTVNNPNADIALDFYTSQTISGSNTINLKSFGLGDFYLQPIWLTWGKKRFSTTFSYGLWIPIGKYKIDDPGNVGMGYWSNNFRLASRFQPITKLSFTACATFELNSKQKGSDFIESPHLTIDYGGSYNFLMGHEIGFFGFGAWQTGNDKGEKAVLLKDQWYGLGIYGSYWFIPGKFGILTRFTGNFGTKNRFGGLSFQVGLNYLLFKNTDKK